MIFFSSFNQKFFFSNAIIHAFAFGSPVFEPKLNIFLLQLWKLLPVNRVGERLSWEKYEIIVKICRFLPWVLDGSCCQKIRILHQKCKNKNDYVVVKIQEKLLHQKIILFLKVELFQKTNENTLHSSKNEFIRSFFGRIHGLTICFRN